MTSNINYLSINQNFPVAGEDNDTQTFRDNFDTIKTSLQAGQEEITALQANTAKTNDNNDFEDNEISRAVFRDVMDRRFDGGIITSPTKEFTMPPKAPPITTPTARSITLPRMANVLNSDKSPIFNFYIICLQSFSFYLIMQVIVLVFRI